MDREFVDIEEQPNIVLMKPTDNLNSSVNEYTYYTHYDNGALYASSEIGSAMHSNDNNGTTYLSMANGGNYPYYATTYPEYTSSGYFLTQEVQSPDTNIPTKEYRSIHYTLQNTTVGNLPLHPDYLLPSPSTSSSKSKYHCLETLTPNNSPQHDYEQPLTSLVKFEPIREHHNNKVHSEAMVSTAPNSDPPSAPTPPLDPSSGSRSRRDRKPREHSEYQCKICSGFYKTRYGLKQHQNSVHSDYQYRCQKCGKRSPTAEVLDEHTVNHSRTDKPWKCEKCPKSYINKGDLARHLKTHDPATKPHQCSKCEKRFVRADHRDQHMNSHARQDSKRKPKRRVKGVDHDVTAGA
ncbi:zinc finger protein CKR1-like [Toxorhynchites rutilus septentrionalis]|uniref:zinc finger protein CKR1-like n=1 Tax=Toxorhynchites rutilus septentrionalis TaxID=329112 RepID=UPI0024787AAB|nr:zinc finger protein CKR1-like [Toxorhynchites rutilus septentrionalis]